MDNTKIEWADATWNPTFGCTKIAAGCAHCYAEALAKGRLKHVYEIPDFNGARQGEHVKLLPERLDQPLRWKLPRRIFVNSLSDLFHDEVPDLFIAQVFASMAWSPWHKFLVLTKRPERMQRLVAGDEFRETVSNCILEALATLPVSRSVGLIDPMHADGWPLPNVWLGVSVAEQKDADANIPLLLQTPAAVRFVSYEPAVGPVDFGRFFDRDMVTGTADDGILGSLDWLIVGGESGPGARPFELAWARSTIAQCKEAGVQCFVKQIGSRPYVNGLAFRRNVAASEPYSMSHNITDRKGGNWDEWPADLRVREFPGG